MSFVFSHRAMALVDDDKIEEVSEDIAEIGRRLAILGGPLMSLEDREEELAFFAPRPLPDVYALPAPAHRRKGGRTR